MPLQFKLDMVYLRNVDLIQSVCILGEEYMKEVGLDLTFTKTPYESVSLAAESDNMQVVYISHEGEPVGFSVLAYDTFFSEEKIGNVYLFYIAPKFRATGASARLLSGTLRTAKYDGVKYLMSTTFSDIDDRVTKAFNAMLVRKGFKPLQPTYMKEL